MLYLYKSGPTIFNTKDEFMNIHIKFKINIVEKYDFLDSICQNKTVMLLPNKFPTAHSQWNKVI